MTEARFLLTVPAQPLDAADALVSEIEENAALDPLAITINETDEANALWEVVVYFGSAKEAEAARTVAGLKNGAIAPLAQQDWVRQSLAGLAPVSAGRFFLHGSHDRLRRRSGGISLEIDAGT